MKTDEFYEYSGRVDCTCDYVYCDTCNEFERRNFNNCPIHSNNIFAGIDFGSGDDNYTVTWTISLGDSGQPYYHLLKPSEELRQFLELSLDPWTKSGWRNS